VPTSTAEPASARCGRPQHRPNIGHQFLIGTGAGRSGTRARAGALVPLPIGSRPRSLTIYDSRGSGRSVCLYRARWPPDSSSFLAGEQTRGPGHPRAVFASPPCHLSGRRRATPQGERQASAVLATKQVHLFAAQESKDHLSLLLGGKLHELRSIARRFISDRAPSAEIGHRPSYISIWTPPQRTIPYSVSDKLYPSIFRALWKVPAICGRW
jgi:hypothetical protein